jgi:hypothetical protein
MIAGEFSRQEYLIPFSCQSFAQYGLAGPISLRGVYECHTTVQSGVDGVYDLLLG